MRLIYALSIVAIVWLMFFLGMTFVTLNMKAHPKFFGGSGALKPEQKNNNNNNNKKFY